MSFEIRWAFNVSSWLPCKQQIITSLAGISLEEIERIQKFRFKEDYKLSLIGRLMIRRCIQLVCGISWSEIQLDRTEKGKPICENTITGNRQLFFNVSHQGDFAVLAASTTCNVGIDVMKFSYPNNTDVPSFFRLMNRQFVESEWDYIKSFKKEWTQLKAFYRLWCLKESYVKAIGVGIGTESAETMRFQIKTNSLDASEKCNDSVLYIDNRSIPWSFNECTLDENHIVTVASEALTSQRCSLSTEFEFITFESLTKDIDMVVPPDIAWWEKYIKKCNKKS